MNWGLVLGITIVIVWTLLGVLDLETLKEIRRLLTRKKDKVDAAEKPNAPEE